MKHFLHFVCPSDFLEPTIRKAFQGQHHFITSLGNSLAIDRDLVEKILPLLESKNIREVFFILSDDNRFVTDALENKEYSDLSGVFDFYQQIQREKGYAEELWQFRNRRRCIFSYHLNDKVGELRLELNRRGIDHIKLKALIYKRSEGIFQDIHPDLMIRQLVSLN